MIRSIALSRGPLCRRRWSIQLLASLSAILVFAILTPEDVSAQRRQSQQRLRGFTVSPGLESTDFDALHKWNANVIRYHLSWDSRADSADSETYLAWLDTALVQLDTVVSECKERGIKVIVNLHTPPGGFKSAAYPSLHRIFVDRWALETFFEAWVRIATRYAGDTTIWGYDILNEPAVRSTGLAIRPWDAIAKDTAAKISSIDRGKKIIVEPIYGDQARLSSISKLSFPNLVVSVHMYYLLRFHQQGIYGNPLNVSYPTKSFNRTSILKNLRNLIRYQERTKGKVPIYIGEFTVNRWAPKNSAPLYLRDALGIMERMKWNWTYHAFREYEAWNLELSSTYGDLRPVIGETPREKLVKQRLALNALPAY